MAPIARYLQVASVVVLVLGLAGATLPGDAGTAAGTAAVTAVIAAPLVRVAWLSLRWWRRHDRRFSLLAAALLAVIGTGGAIALAS